MALNLNTPNAPWSGGTPSDIPSRRPHATPQLYRYLAGAAPATKIGSAYQ